jgi:diguanylate cyclase (GGDEF)-like protein
VSDAAGREDLSHLRPAVRGVLGLVAVAVVLGWSVGASVDTSQILTAGIVTVLAVTARIADLRRRGPALDPALIFVGALVLLVDGTLAVWGSALVGLAGLLVAEPWVRTLATTAGMTLASSAAASARLLADAVVTDQPTVGSAGLGPLAAEPIGIVSTLVVVVVLALAWEAVRWVSAWLDRRARTDAWRARSEGRWLLDATLACGAALAAITWAVYPPVVLVLIVPMLAVVRVVEQAAGGPTTTAGRDSLTGLATPGVLRAALAEELARAARFERPVAVVVIRVDDLARVHALRGDAIADEVMRHISDLTGAAARDYDVVARLGDDALALVLPEAPLSGAVGVAARVRGRVAETPLVLPDTTIATTVSVGVASFPSEATTREGLLTEAEMAAEYAALAGGDRVQPAADLPPGFRASPRAMTIPTAPSRPPPAPEPLAPDRLVRAAPEPLADARPRTDRLLLAVTAAALVATVVGVAVVRDPVDWAPSLLLAGLAVVAGGFADSIHGRASASWSMVPLVALAVLPETAPGGVALAAVVTGAGGGALSGVRARQAAFNSAVLVLSTLLAWVVAGPLVAVGSPSLGGWAAVGVVAGLAFAAVDTTLVAAAIALAGREGVLSVWRDDLMWLVPHQLGMGLLGGLMAYAWLALGAAGVLLLALPALGLHLAQRQFLRRTRDQVVRLRRENEDATDTSLRVERVNDRLTTALDQVNAGYLSTLETVVRAVASRDGYDAGHLDRVEAYARLLAQATAPELIDQDGLRWGFRFHDVGKISLPDTLLSRSGPLGEDEWPLVRRHPEIGAELISRAPFLEGARDVILHHHERWDGAGYPFGLAAEAIPFPARLLAVVDAYEAMTCDRPYRGAMSTEHADQDRRRNICHADGSVGTRIGRRVAVVTEHHDLTRAEFPAPAGDDLDAVAREPYDALDGAPVRLTRVGHDDERAAAWRSQPAGDHQQAVPGTQRRQHRRAFDVEERAVHQPRRHVDEEPDHGEWSREAAVSNPADGGVRSGVRCGVSAS